MPKERVAVYFDGFNLYHGLSDLKADHLKWVNLWKLSELLISRNTQRLVKVAYFSAFAEHFKNTPQEPSLHRHKAYVAALEAKDVQFVPGNFANRKWNFSGGPRYRATWKRREEKQTDVAIGVNVIRDAFKDEFDIAMIVSADADMQPVFRMMRLEFPNKTCITVAPPNRPHHQSLIELADDVRTIRRSQVEKALFGPVVRRGLKVVARRPAAYRPPLIA